MLHRSLAFAVTFLAAGAFLAPTASAQNCDQLPGSIYGRPTNWAEILRQWPWGDVCWRQWAYTDTASEREHEALCRQSTPGTFLHFQRDLATGARVSTCFFRASDSGSGSSSSSSSRSDSSQSGSQGGGVSSRSDTTEESNEPRPTPPPTNTHPSSRTPPRPLPWGAVAAYDDVYVWVRGNSEGEVRTDALAKCIAKTGKNCDVVTVEPNMCVCMVTVNYQSTKGHRTQVFIRKDWMHDQACEDAFAACEKRHPGKCRPQEQHCANKRL